MTSTDPSPQTGLPRSLLLLMAAGVGISVANIYYNQPLLNQMKDSFTLSEAQTGLIPTLTQAGYAVGMLFLVPIGDMFERRRLVMAASIFSAAFALLLALTGNFSIVLVSCFFLGVSTMTPQFLIPYAAHLAAPSARGKTLGTMMSGLLLGILLARTIAGFIGASFGWRTMFIVAACLQVFLCVALGWKLPVSTPTYKGSYGGLLKSVTGIFWAQPELREACFFGATLFAAFSGFWANFIHLMSSANFGYGPRAVGLFGLLGAAAAAVTPLMGSWTDRKKPRTATGYMIILSIISFFVLAISSRSLLGLAIGVVLMDIGVQAGHVSNQTRIFGLIPNAHSRIQTAYMFFYFLGGAIGSLIGSWAWSIGGWTGVTVGSECMLLIAASLWLKGFKLPSQPADPSDRSVL